MRVALSSTAWNTGASSPGELEMTRNTSDVASLISDLTLKQTYLSAAQKVFVSTSSLTLLNYLK